MYSLILQESFLNGSFFSRALAHLCPERWLIFSGTVAQNTPYYSVNGQLPDRYSRHYYDLFMLSHTEIKVEAFQDTLLLDAVVRFIVRNS